MPENRNPAAAVETYSAPAPVIRFLTLKQIAALQRFSATRPKRDVIRQLHDAAREGINAKVPNPMPSGQVTLTHDIATVPPYPAQRATEDKANLHCKTYPNNSQNDVLWLRLLRGWQLRRVRGRRCIDQYIRRHYPQFSPRCGKRGYFIAVRQSAKKKNWLIHS